MKKILVFSLFIILLLSLGACTGDKAENTLQSNNTQISHSNVVTPIPYDSEKPVESGAYVQRKALVVYFSCTGNTEAVAKKIAELTGADLYEIVPEQPYTDEDINYNNDDCRANMEMNDDTARPAISGGIDKLEDYDVLYIGYPIWWGTMPRILNTFFDTYDLSGKTVFPFCTSGGSGISASVSAIKEAEPNADIKSGLQIGSSSASNCANAVTQWLKDNGQIQ